MGTKDPNVSSSPSGSLYSTSTRLEHNMRYGDARVLRISELWDNTSSVDQREVAAVWQTPGGLLGTSKSEPLNGCLEAVWFQKRPSRAFGGRIYHFCRRRLCVPHPGQKSHSKKSRAHRSSSIRSSAFCPLGHQPAGGEVRALHLLP